MNNSVSPIVENTNSNVPSSQNINQKSLVKHRQSEQITINDHHVSRTKRSLLLMFIPLSFHSLGIIFGDM
jgi:hypothetical protein